MCVCVRVRVGFWLQMEQCSQAISKKMSTVEENQTAESEAKVREYDTHSLSLIRSFCC